MEPTINAQRHASSSFFYFVAAALGLSFSCVLVVLAWNNALRSETRDFNFNSISVRNVVDANVRTADAIIANLASFIAADDHDDKARELGEEFVVSEDVTDHKYEPHANATMKTSKGHTHVGVSYNSAGNKGANILKHGDTGKYFAAGGSSSSTNARTTYHDSPEAAAKEYHSRY